MVAIKVGIFFFCALAFSVLMMEVSRGRLGRNGALAGLMTSLSSIYRGDTTFLNCIVESMDLREVLKPSAPISVYGVVNDHTKISPLPKCGVLDVLTSRSPAVKHVFLKCLIARGSFLGISRHDRILSKIYSGYLDHPVLRRHLADQNLQNSGPLLAPVPGPASAPVLGPASAPVPGPASAPVLGPASAPVPGPASAPVPGPASVLVPAPASVLVPSPVIPLKPPTPSPAPGGSPSHAHHFPPFARSPTEAGAPDYAQILPNKEGNGKVVIVAAVLSSSGTFLLLACGFCCYRKCSRSGNNSSYEKDESPFLNLSISNFSGSSNESFVSGNSIPMGSLTSRTDPKRNSHAITIDSSADGASISDIISGYSSAQNVPPFKSVNGLELNVALPKPPGMDLQTHVVPSSTSTVHPPAPFSSPQLTSPPPPPPPPMAPSINKASPTPPAPPPPLPARTPGSTPPLPPSSRPPPYPGVRPPPPPTGHPSQAKSNSKPMHSSLRTNYLRNSDEEGNSSAPKTKLKPLFWDKVLAKPDQSMVWHQIKSGSFEFSEEMIETLFCYNNTAKSNGENKKESLSIDSSTQYIQLLNPKKSQNLAISLKALNVKTEDVCNALKEGEKLPTDLLQTLLRLQPTTDEELKIKLYTGDLLLLGPAERFLKALIDIPFAFKRIDVLLFMSSLYEDVTSTKESFATLEEACTELRNNRLFLKLLEAVLKTGNRMNDGTFRGGAQAFKLDTLLKLADVKGSDGQTTLLHFVVQEIIRSEGVREACLAREGGNISGLSSYCFKSDDFPDDSPNMKEDDYHILGLKVVSGLSNELVNVKKAAGIDIDALISGVASFDLGLVNITDFLNKDMKILGEDSGFCDSLKCFVEHAEAAITFLLEEEKRIRSLVQKTTDYFHGNAGKDEGLRLFVIVRDFLGMLDKACKEVKETQKKILKPPKVKSNLNGPSVPDPRQLLFPVIADRRMDNSSSDEE